MIMFLESAVILSEAKDVEMVISGTKNINKGSLYNLLVPWLGTGLLTSGGEKWHQRRKILTPSFHFTVLQNYLKTFHTESHNMVDFLKKNCFKSLNIVPVVTTFTLNSICETAMGVSPNKHERYRNAISSIGQMIVHRLTRLFLTSDLLFSMTHYYWQQKKLLTILHNFSSNIISERKKEFLDQAQNNMEENGGKKKLAMLDLLLKEQFQNGIIDDEGIREEVDTFMFEGHDTTAMSLIFTLMALANEKKCQDKIYEEICEVFGASKANPTNSDLQALKYMEMCIKESLRLYPSVPTISRVASRDIVMGNGKIIPEGCSVVIFIDLLHRNLEVFPNPDKFDPDRFLPENTAKRNPYAYIPFSIGSRNCIGQKFAMMELKCALVEIMRNFELEPVTKPEDIKFISDIVLRASQQIYVKFIPRKSEGF